MRSATAANIRRNTSAEPRGICDDHVGLEHPPRCYKCDAEGRDQQLDNPTKSETAAMHGDRF